MHSETRNLFPVIALWSIILLPWLFGKGIFADGLFYGTISRNWAFGAGNFWYFYVSESLMNPFYSHPPLAFWLQGSLFRVFGDHYWVDKVYSLLTFVLTVIAMLRIWKLYFPAHQSWLPLFVLILFPTASWAYSNNVLENSLSMCCIWAVYLQLSAAENPKYGFLKNIFSGILIFAAALCKGPTGLFPLALPFLLMFFKNKRTWTQILFSFSPLAVFSLAVLLLFTSDEASTYLKAYFEIQIQGSFTSVEKNGQPLLLKQLIVEVLPILSISFLLNYWLNKKIILSKSSFLMLIIAAAASLPILISPKQMGFYILPSVPFWALGFAAMVQKLEILKRNIAPRLKLYLSAIVLILAVFLMLYNRNNAVRDAALIEDISKICTYVPKSSKVGLDPKLVEHWQLQGYFAREKKVSFYPIGHPKYRYNVGGMGYKLDGCEILYKGKELQLCRCPMPE